MQMFAIVVSLAATAVAVVLTTRAVRHMVGVIRTGQPASRTDEPLARLLTMLKESLLHTRMLQWHWIGILHWFVYAAFIFLSSAVAAGYVQLFDPMFEIPVVGTWWVYGWAAEILGLLGTLGIIALAIYRQVKHPRSLGRRSRFFGSNFWQAYFVEAMVLLESAAILFIRGAEYKLHDGNTLHFPLSHLVGEWFYPDSEQALKNIVFFVAMVKITSAMLWLVVIASNLTMGVAWHRFTAWFNIFFKREADGTVALGAMKPLTSDGKAITLDDIDDLDEDSVLGAGKVEDFSWKGILDFTTCTECGRCQSQCPAWNTEKPLSPKLLITSLRDHAYAKADPRSADHEAHAERALVGVGSKGESAGSGTDVLDYFYNPADGDFVIDEDVLWSCTSCGACVQQCPVDIEHVDHIMDMRRYQLLVESNFPAELNQLFKGLENKGNPWNMSPSSRMDWAKGLEFDVPVVGEDLESLESVDWLFWVGCAGAYEDRAKKTTRAVAELLDIAGISFGVLGNGETCTGDPARRAGNEFVFQGLAQQNVETFKEYKVKKVVSTCAHCFNTLKNEYKDFGIELEVVHHTQLLNRLVREGKLTPVKEGAGAAKRSITYHDPCYLGRHNQVYSPPRELLQVLPGAEYVEMERNSERSFCCGAGGARMWMEENLGERINVNRTKEAVGTGADQIAVGCPFCRVMLSDGLTAEQAKGEAREEVEVLDVAQMLLASVKGEQATKAAPGSSPAPSAAPAAAPAAASADVATKDEPETGDVTVTEDTVTETADAGPAAKASGGSSLFDTPAPEAAGTATEETAQTPAEEPAEKPAEKPAADLGSGGSLFDLDTPEPEAAPAPAPTPAEASTPAETAESKPAESKPAEKPSADLGGGGSLFDIAAPEPEPEPQPAAESESAAQAPVTSATTSTPATDADLSSLGSLFDLEAPAAEPASAPAAEPEVAAEPEPAVAAESPSDSAASEAPVDAESPSDSAPSEGAEAPASSGTTSTPNTDVDISGVGSLFDLEAPAGEPASAPAAEPEVAAEPEPAMAAESPSDSAPSEAPVDAESPSDSAPSEGAEAPASSGTTSTPNTDVDISGVGSLFDIEAPATTAAPAAAAPEAAAEPEPSAEPEPEAAVEPEPEAAAAPPSGADLSQAATFRDPEDLKAEAAPAQTEEPTSEPEATEPEAAEAAAPADEDDVPPAEEKAEQTEPQPAKQATAAGSDGPAHTPRTDVDISGSGSLFDL